MIFAAVIYAIGVVLMGAICGAIQTKCSTLATDVIISFGWPIIIPIMFVMLLKKMKNG